MIQAIGRYRVMEPMGSGYYGDVVKAHDPVLKRDVAIKIPSFNIKRHDLAQLLRGFQREAEITAQLRHTNIVGVYDVGSNKLSAEPESSGYWPHYLVMEYVDGRDLKALLADYGPLYLQDAFDVIYHVCMALDYIHDKGIIHRDIKPANILVNLEKRLFKVMDFGIAQEVDADPVKGEGSLSYMSPENFLEDGVLSARSDIFSLGCVMYELLSGRVAYTGSSIDVVKDKLLRGDVIALSTHNPHLPDEVCRIVEKAMSTDPEDRYESTLAFAKALNDIGSELSDVNTEEVTDTSGMNQYVALRETEWFDNFTPKQANELINATTNRTYSQGEYVFKEGDDADDYYVLIQGEAAIERDGQYLSSLSAGESFGEMGLGIRKRRERTASIKAQSDLNVLVVQMEKMSELSGDTRAALYRMFVDALMARITRMNDELLSGER